MLSIHEFTNIHAESGSFCDVTYSFAGGAADIFSALQTVLREMLERSKLLEKEKEKDQEKNQTIKI